MKQTFFALSALMLILIACAPAPTPAPTAAPPTAAPAQPTAVSATAAPAQPTAAQPTAVPPTAAPTFAPVTLKIGQVGSISDGAIFIADAKGFFKEQGITLDSTTFQSAALMIAPLGTNELQVGGGAVSAGLLNAYARGINLAIVADKATLSPGNGYEAVIVRKDLVDKIKSAKDMKGLNIAIALRDITPEVSLNTYLKTGGLTINDVNVVTLAFPDMIAAMQNKAIDVAVPTEPTVSRMVSAGVGTVLIRSDAFAPNEQTAVILFSEKFAAQKDVATRFMVAYLKGTRLYNDAFTKKDPKARAEVVDILAKATKLETTLFDTMYFPGLDPNGKVNVASLEEVQAYFLAKGSQQKAVDLNKVVDMSFADAAVKILGPYK